MDCKEGEKGHKTMLKNWRGKVSHGKTMAKQLFNVSSMQSSRWLPPAAPAPAALPQPGHAWKVARR